MFGSFQRRQALKGPGCGPNAKPLDLRFEKNGHVGASVVEGGGIITSKGSNDVENSATADMKSNRVENSEMANNVEANAGLHNDLEDISIKEVIEAEGQTMEGLNRAKDLALVKYIDSEEVKPVMVIGGSQLLSSPKGPICNDSVKLGTSFGHKDKFHRRRVSAVHDFPLFCGPNAPQPTEGRQMISHGKGRVDIKNFKVETDETRKLRKTLERGALMETPKISETQSVDGVEKDKVRTEATKTIRGRIGENVRKKPLWWGLNCKAVAKRSKIERDISGGPSMKKKEIPVPVGHLGALVLGDKKIYGVHDENLLSKTHASYVPHDFDVSIPLKCSSHGDARTKVIETLRLFRSVCRQHSQDEAKSENPSNRIDLHAAKLIKQAKKEVNTGKPILGEVPGVQVGDEFQYRVELAIVGIHRLYQTGIDSMKHNGISVAISVVDAGVYTGDKHNADVLIYSGHGGNIVGKNKQPEDQKLERGNLALKNSISMMTPVRVIRGWKETNRSGNASLPLKAVIVQGDALTLENADVVVKNGGEIPYNRNGDIVEARTIVYDCILPVNPSSLL
ncbi:unnamed protein product [Fraxinus pennsylvanica]|uniref:YDG domain-containing protein n=1 Tax=Fraxinus pennsylvanica TaxID=56036 RepID=A0AAD2AGF6_9LAMI|nr:unnamed protein product [Fraxinus pennsylvanica]